MKNLMTLSGSLCFFMASCTIFHRNAGAQLRSGASPDVALVAPWEKPGFRPGPGSERFTFNAPCPGAPPAVHDLDVPMFYSDENNSIVNPELKARYDAGTRSVRSFQQGLGKSANAALYQKSGSAALCALGWLTTWAQGGALLGKMAADPSDKRSLMQGGFVRKWALASVAQSYLKIRSHREVKESADNALVLEWISRVDEAVARDVESYGPSSAKNNHIYWAGLARMVAGVALGNRQAFQWSADVYRMALDQIQEDGTLPLELTRRGQALHYHYFALTPLLLMAAFSEANGLFLYGEKKERIHKLENLLIPTLENPDAFSAVSGTPVSHDFHDSYAWVELLRARSASPEATRFLKAHRPIEEIQLSDDMTALWGVVD